jgi:hypothetical protein
MSGVTSALEIGNLLNVALAAQVHSSMFYVVHTVCILTISITSNGCTLQYNTHDIHKLLRVSAQRCHHQGVKTNTGVQANLPLYVLFILMNVIRTLIVNIHKIVKICKIDSNDDLQ